MLPCWCVAGRFCTMRYCPVGHRKWQVAANCPKSLTHCYPNGTPASRKSLTCLAGRRMMVVSGGKHHRQKVRFDARVTRGKRSRQSGIPRIAHEVEGDGSVALLRSPSCVKHRTDARGHWESVRQTTYSICQLACRQDDTDTRSA